MRWFRLLRRSEPATRLDLPSGFRDDIGQQNLIEQSPKRQLNHLAGYTIVAVEHFESKLFSPIINLGFAGQRFESSRQLDLDLSNGLECQHPVKLHLGHLKHLTAAPRATIRPKIAVNRTRISPKESHQERHRAMAGASPRRGFQVLLSAL